MARVAARSLMLDSKLALPLSLASRYQYLKLHPRGRAPCLFHRHADAILAATDASFPGSGCQSSGNSEDAPFYTKRRPNEVNNSQLEESRGDAVAEVG